MWSSAALRELWTRHPRSAAALGYLLLTLPMLWFLRGLLTELDAVGDFGDIRTFHFFWEVSRKTVLEFGQLPFWNPYYCGGMVEWANAETMMLAPTFLVDLLFGPGVGIRVHIVAHFIAGFIGCWVLARHHGLRPPWALAVCVVFGFSGNFPERATGHVGFMPFLLLPWLAYFFERARVELRWAAPLALVIAYSVFAGAPYPFILFMLYLALLVAWDSAAATIAWRRGIAGPRQMARAPLLGLTVALLVGLVVAVKAYVVADFMRDHPRLVPEYDYLSKWQVWEMFLRPEMARERKGYRYVFGEYRQYLGLAMLAVPFMLLRARRHARDYFLLSVLFVLMLGRFAWWSPYALMQKLPIFESLRVPARYALLMDLHIALLFGFMLQRAAEVAGEIRRPEVRRGVLAGLGIFLAAVTWDLSRENNRQLFGFYHVSPDAQPRHGPFRMTGGQGGLVFQAPLRNEGHLRCYAPNPLAISSALRPDQPSEVRLAEGRGSASVVSFSPNEIVVELESQGAALVALNMNYHRDWRVDGGEPASWRGLLGARVTGGQQRLRFWYKPRRFELYAGMTLAGLFACLMVWRRR